MTPLAVSTSLAFEGIPLEAYYPYVAGQLNGPLKGFLDFSGELSFADKLLSADKIATRLFRSLSARGHRCRPCGRLHRHSDLVQPGQGKNGLAGDFKGELGVRNFYCLDAEHEEDLLKWESLQLDEISGSLDPFSLTVKDVSLSKYFAKVVVNKDGTLNLQQLRKPAKKEGGAEKTALPPASAALAPAAPPGQSPAPPQPKSVRIDTITFQDGLIDFTDHHMTPEFATTML